MAPKAANWFLGFPVDGGEWLAPLLETAPDGLRQFHPDDLHATVAFLGACGEDAARRAFARASRLSVPTFDVTLRGLKAMGSRARPSAYSLLMGGDDALADWMTGQKDLLLAAAGAPPNRWGRSLPHVTVARPGRRASRKLLHSAAGWVKDTAPLDVRLRLDRLALYTWSDDRGTRLFKIVDERATGAPPPQRYEGGCHCGAVRFSVVVRNFEALDCNCSICRKKGILHVIVEGGDLTLLQGEDALSSYTFGTHTAKHTFCSVCGMHPFYTPRSHPDGWDINARCLDGDALDDFVVTPFDGRNWEQSVETIRQRPGSDTSKG